MPWQMQLGLLQFAIRLWHQGKEICGATFLHYGQIFRIIFSKNYVSVKEFAIPHPLVEKLENENKQNWKVF